MSSTTSAAGQAAESTFDTRAFLEGLRRRVLAVTAGMRPGIPRLELAIEAFWYHALEHQQDSACQKPWAQRAQSVDAKTNLLSPIRMMIRSELMSAGFGEVDALTAELFSVILDIADAECAAGKALPERRLEALNDFRSRLPAPSSARHRMALAA